MTTTQNVLDRTKRLVLTGYRDEQNRLTNTVSANATSLVFDFAPGGMQQGARVSLDLEDYYCWSSTGTSTCTAVVQPGQFGTVSAAHTAGAIAFVNPHVSQAEILVEINNVLDDISSPANGLYDVDTVDISFNGGITGYDLAGVTSIIDIIDVRWKDFGNWKDWPIVEPSKYRLITEQSPSEFASGFGLLVYDSVGPGRTMHVRYKAPYTHLATVSDDVAAVSGLHATAHDLLSLGAALRLSETRDIRRSFTDAQGQSRSSAEVPPGSATNAIRGIASRYQQRIQAEAARLSNSNPSRVAV